MKSLSFTCAILVLVIPSLFFAQQTASTKPSTPQQMPSTTAKALPQAPPLLSPNLCGSVVYLFSMNGKPVGRETVDVKCLPDGGFFASASTEMTIPGAAVNLHTSLELDQNAVPTKFVAKGNAAANAVDQLLILKDGKATFTVNGNPQEVAYTPGAAFLTPNITYVIPFVAARYDTAKGGPQEIALFPSMKLRMERLGHDEVQATGPTVSANLQAFDRYNIQIGVVSLLLWADSKGRVALISIPMQSFVAVREEYAAYVEPLRMAMASAAKAVEPDYSATADAPFTAEEVTVRANDITLGGTLLLPKSGKRPFPAVITITGSGQQTRDEPIPIAGLEKYRPFRQIAESLASQGIAVLRVDDRGVGKSTGRETLLKVTTFDFADDTRAQIAYLRTRPEIDPKRIALVGHSEGGIIAPIIASTDPNIAAIVLMAGTAKTGEAVIVDQTSDLLDRDPILTLEEKAKRLAGQKILLRTIVEGGDISKLPDTVKNAWYKAFLIYDPLPTIRKVKQPILILQGEIDRQVTAEQATALEKAAHDAGNKNVTVRVFPNLNHLFLPAKTGSFNEYSSLTVTSLGDEVLNTLDDWLVSTLKVKK
jgi:hypothetical protein